VKEFLKGVKGRRTLVIVVAVLVLGSGAFLAVRSLGVSARHSPSAQLSFSTARVRRGSITVTVTGTGTLAPKTKQSCTVSAGGKVVSVAVLPGQRVKAGEVLMVLTNQSLSNQLTQARLNLRQAQMDLDALTKPGASSATEADVAAAQAAVLQARLQVEQAKDNVDGLTVKAPFDGLVSGLTVRPGDKVAAGTTLCTVVTPDSLKATLAVNEDDVKLLSVGQQLVLTVSPLIRDLKGHIVAISLEPTTGSTSQVTYQVTVQLDETDPQVRGGMTVTTTVPGPGPWSEPLTLKGTLAYEQTRAMVTATGGTVVSVNAADGDSVKSGEVLLTLESEQAQVALANAEAGLAAAEQRLAQLTNPGPSVYPESQIEKAKMQVEQAQLNVENLERQYNELTVTAAIDGTVTDVAYGVGDQVPPNGAVATVADLSKVEAVVSIDELQVAQLSPGQTAEVTLDALPGRTFTGTLESVALEGSVSDGVTSYQARVLLDGSDQMRVGMSCSVSIQVARHDNVLLVPVEAVYGSGDKATVQVVVNGKPELRQVVAGLSNDTYTEIVKGLSEGETVVTGSLSQSSGNMFMPGIPGGGVRVPGAGGGYGPGRNTQPTEGGGR